MRKFKFFKNESREFPWLVPYSWEQRRLGDVGNARSGIGFPDAEQGGKSGIPFFKVSDMNSSGNENEMITANNYVSQEQIRARAWSIIDELPAMFFAKVGAAVMLNRKRLCRMPFLCDNNTMAFSLATGNWQSDFAKAIFETINLPSLVQVGALPSYNASDVEGIEISIPKIAEQEKIGTFFRSLDRLITLHQRKHFYVFPKTGAFHNEKTNAWEQREFSKTFSMLPNNTLSRAELDYEQGFAKNVHYGDVLIKFGECLDISCEVLPLIADAKKAAKYKSSALQTGDVVFADTAEDETVGKCSEIIGLQGETVVSGLHTIPCRPLLPFASGYLGYYMNSDSFHHQLLPLMQGIKVTSISKSALQTTEVIYPGNDKEQSKIGSFFRSLDRLITLHQRKPLFLFLEELRC